MSFYTLKEGRIKDLPTREERAIAKMAKMARNDVYFGGARALTIAKRLAKMGSPIDYEEIVIASYHDNNGNAVDFLPYECPECGCTHLGEEAAAKCCVSSEDDWEYFEDFE